MEKSERFVPNLGGYFLTEYIGIAFCFLAVSSSSMK